MVKHQLSAGRAELYSYIATLPIDWTCARSVQIVPCDIDAVRIIFFDEWVKAYPEESEQYERDILQEPFKEFVAGHEVMRLVVRIAAYTYLCKPLELQSLFAAVGSVCVYELIVVIGDGAQIVIHDYRAQSKQHHTVRAVTYYVGARAQVTICEAQQLPEYAQEITYVAYVVREHAQLQVCAVYAGGALTRAHYRIVLTGKYAYARIQGFYGLHGRQQLLVYTEQHHQAAYATSDVLFRGGIAGESRMVYCGSIDVDALARMTVARQLSTTLVLESHAQAQAIPGLQVKTDDVQCKHGAAIAPLDQQQLDYLLARGVSLPRARQILLEGFFAEVAELPYTGATLQSLVQQVVEKLG